LRFLALLAPVFFGLSPPQFFHGHDAVTQQAKTDELPPGNHSASDMSPQVAQPDASPAIVAVPETSRDDVNTTDAKDGLMRDAPDQVLAPEPLLVPRDFFTHIPDSHLAISGTAQKESFIKIVLPLILASNEEISKRREAIKRAFENGDRATLEKWAKLYTIGVANQGNKTLMTRLLERADTIPVALALAQAAVESGWGTSRFAIQGNALFGQWAWRDQAGIRPLDASNDRAVVRSFGSLLGSVRAYMHNLNTHSHYQKFRKARAALRNRPKAGEARILAKYLDRYAEIGEAYVKKLEVLIRSNDFSRFALAYLS
jgi:Bax protein